jgi:hypothetical protein
MLYSAMHTQRDQNNELAMRRPSGFGGNGTCSLAGALRPAKLQSRGETEVLLVARAAKQDLPLPPPMATPEAVETVRAFGKIHLTSIWNDHIIDSEIARASFPKSTELKVVVHVVGSSLSRHLVVSLPCRRTPQSPSDPQRRDAF